MNCNLPEIQLFEGFQPLKGFETFEDLEAEVQDALFASSSDLHTFALLDAARAAFLTERIEADQLESACLFRGAALETQADVAPWLINIDPAASLTRSLFSGSTQPSALWQSRPGIIFRSGLDADVLVKNFRRHTMAPDETGKRVYFRFWEPYVAFEMLRSMRPEASTVFQGVHSIICPLDHHTLGYVKGLQTDTSGHRGSLMISKNFASQLRFWRQKQSFIEIAEALAPKFDISAADWVEHRARVVEACGVGLQLYGFRTRKYLEAYVLLNLSFSHLWEDQRFMGRARTKMLDVPDQNARMRLLMDQIKSAV